ncbi:hypothetical protein DKG34_10985 [Streptomyces sp. NWU49]|uniref:hypothetical protein n=1 Tax=Streptomyces sp. NWU49 TaxID=2201153 RepID=UPI000D67C228|nr:hypothetical protein [Streptomyces sp. NWU49]PWJ07920.1 hypothetical protein DKG34_10985 [Streptomyces sp. NWU49]
MASPWATPDELRHHLRLATIDEAQAAAAIAAAERVIRAEIQQTIDLVTDDTAYVVGAGRQLVNLPEWPVTAVTSVHQDGELLEHGEGYRWNRFGMLTRLPGRWPLDAEIVVVYSHGYATVPAAVKQVCLQVAGRAWARPSTAVSAESLGDRSVTYDKDRTGEALTEYEQRMLQPYARGNESR